MPDHDLVAESLDELESTVQDLRLDGSSAALALAADIEALVARHRSGGAEVPPHHRFDAPVENIDEEELSTAHLDAFDESLVGDPYIEVVEADDNPGLPAPAPVPMITVPGAITLDDEDDEADAELPIPDLQITYRATDGQALQVDSTLFVDAEQMAQDTLRSLGELIVTNRTANTDGTVTATCTIADPGDIDPRRLLPGNIAVNGVVPTSPVIEVTAIIVDPNAEPDTDPAGDLDATFAELNRIRDEAIAEMADAEGVPVEIIQMVTPTRFVVVFEADVTLDDVTLRPLLAAAAGTLAHFGQLAITEQVIDGPVATVTYEVVEAGPLGLDHLANGLTEWRGELTFPGIGRVKAHAKALVA